jgi:hypothetical protein
MTRNWPETHLDDSGCGRCPCPASTGPSLPGWGSATGFPWRPVPEVGVSHRVPMGTSSTEGGGRPPGSRWEPPTVHMGSATGFPLGTGLHPPEMHPSPWVRVRLARASAGAWIDSERARKRRNLRLQFEATVGDLLDADAPGEQWTVGPTYVTKKTREYFVNAYGNLLSASSSLDGRLILNRFWCSPRLELS